MYIVCFNGPPECGKDTLSRLLVEHIENQRCDIPVLEESLSLPLRHIAYAMVGESYGAPLSLDYGVFKNTWYAQLGRSGRELMIDASERFLKQVYGSEIMAQMLLTRTMMFDGLLLVRDCGFQLELGSLVRFVGLENVYLVNVMRPGKDFSNDSREWVTFAEHEKKQQMQVNNAGSLDDLAVEAGRIYGRLVNQLGWKL